MTQLPEDVGANPVDAPVQEVVETKEATSPTNDVESYRKLQSQLDKERSEREKAEADREYLQSQIDLRLTQEQQAEILKERKAREAEERAAAAEKRAEALESSLYRDKLIQEKYPYLKSEEFADVVDVIQGSPEQIDVYLGQLDAKLRAASNILAKEESAKKSASPISQAVEPASAANMSYDDFKQMKPENKAKVAQSMFMDWKKKVLG